MTHHQGQIFQKFKEKERFVSMVSKFGVNNSTILFKIALVKLINNYPKIKNSSLSLHFFKKHLKMIKEICKENASEFKNFFKFTFSLNDFIAKRSNVQFAIF